MYVYVAVVVWIQSWATITRPFGFKFTTLHLYLGKIRYKEGILKMFEKKTHITVKNI